MADNKATTTWTYEFATRHEDDIKYIVKWIRESLEKVEAPDEVISHSLTRNGKWDSCKYTATLIVKRVATKLQTSPPL